MGKKSKASKTKKVDNQAFNARGSLIPHNSPNLLDGDSINSAVSLVDINVVERCLSRIILRPHTQAHPLNGTEKKYLDKCRELCEKILMASSECAKLEQVQKTQIEINSASAFNSKEGMRGILLENANLSPISNPEEKKLLEMRTEIIQRYEQSLPRDLHEWLTSWDKKIDLRIAEKFMNCLGAVPDLINRQVSYWEQCKANARLSRFGMGIFTRLKALKLAKKFTILEKDLEKIKYEIDFFKRKVLSTNEYTAKICGNLATFVKIPDANSGIDSKKVQKVVLIDVEKELSEKLMAQRNENQGSSFEINSQINQFQMKMQQLKLSLKEVYGNYEQSKIKVSQNQTHDFVRLCSGATAMQIRQTFEELEYKIAVETEKTKQLRDKKSQSLEELQLLLEVIHEYTNASSDTFVRDFKQPRAVGPRTTSLNSLRSVASVENPALTPERLVTSKN